MMQQQLKLTIMKTIYVVEKHNNKFRIFSINKNGEQQDTGFSFYWPHKAEAKKRDLEWANHPTMETLYHPKTKLLKREIKRVDSCDPLIGRFYFDDDGDTYADYTECIDDAKKDMEYYYSGEHSKDCMEHYANAAAERGQSFL